MLSKPASVVDTMALPKIGPDTVLGGSEENILVKHLLYMSTLGYEYTVKETARIATDYAVSLGKKLPSDAALTKHWYYGFRSRWPELKFQKPRKVSGVRAKSTSKEVVDMYHSQLWSILDTHKLLEQPDYIYVLDEITLLMEPSDTGLYSEGVFTEDGDISLEQSKRFFTMIGCGNASGSLVPPYLILPGTEWHEQYLEGTCSGSGGECSPDGLCSSLIMKNYFETHFKKFVRVGNHNKSKIVLYDGHKTQLLLSLKSWAEKNNIIFFVIPPYASFVANCEMGCFNSLRPVFNKECLNYLKQKQNISLTNDDAAEVASSAYLKAMTPLTLSKEMARIGIYPFDSTAVEVLSVSDHPPDEQVSE